MVFTSRDELHPRRKSHVMLQTCHVTCYPCHVTCARACASCACVRVHARRDRKIQKVATTYIYTHLGRFCPLDYRALDRKFTKALNSQGALNYIPKCPELPNSKTPWSPNTSSVEFWCPQLSSSQDFSVLTVFICGSRIRPRLKPSWDSSTTDQCLLNKDKVKASSIPFCHVIKLRIKKCKSVKGS
jgi:hypothetical protein